jgi:hypothetical protein
MPLFKTVPQAARVSKRAAHSTSYAFAGCGFYWAEYQQRCHGFARPCDADRRYRQRETRNDTALRFAGSLNNVRRSGTNLQTRYDLEVAEGEIADLTLPRCEEIATSPWLPGFSGVVFGGLNSCT